MTSPLLTRYGHNAELARGLKWVDEFESQETVARNGGAETSAPVINNGATFDGTDDYITYDIGGDTFADAASISLVIEFEPDFATDEDADRALLGTTGSDYLINKATNAANNVLSIVLGGTTIADIAEATYSPAWVQNGRNILVVSGTTGNTNAWLNGTQILTADATAWTPATQDVLVIGAAAGASNFFDGTINSVKIFNVVLTADEAADYYNRTTWRYREDTIFYLPMLGAQHDPDNVRTLDKSGNGHNFSLGDGATPATYPTKLGRRGYSYIGDYFTNTTIPVSTYNSDFSFECFIKNDAYGPQRGICGIRDANNDGWGIIIFPSGQISPRYNTLGATTTNIIMTPGELYHVVATFDVSGSMRIFVNGREGDTVTDISGETIDLTTNVFLLAAIGSGAVVGNLLVGEMYQAAMYSRVLTPTQIWDRYLKLMGELNDA